MKTEKTIEMLKAQRKKLLLGREKVDVLDKNERNRFDVKLATVTNQLYQLTKNPIYRINKTQRFHKRNEDID
jgi:hypothetical protein